MKIGSTCLNAADRTTKIETAMIFAFQSFLVSLLYLSSSTSFHSLQKPLYIITAPPSAAGYI